MNLSNLILFIFIMLDVFKQIDMFPVYVFRENYCDKIEKKESSLSRIRYFVIGNTCTCLGFMKVEKCRHLRMLADDFTFLSGVPGFRVARDLEDISEKFIRVGWVKKWLTDYERMPKKLYCIKFNVHRRIYPEIFKVVFVRHYKKVGHFAIEINFDKN